MPTDEAEDARRLAGGQKVIADLRLRLQTAAHHLEGEGEKLREENEQLRIQLQAAEEKNKEWKNNLVRAALRVSSREAKLPPEILEVFARFAPVLDEKGKGLADGVKSLMEEAYGVGLSGGCTALLEEATKPVETKP